jgi:hypothetical protein
MKYAGLGWSGIAAAFQWCYGEGHFAHGLVLIRILGRIVQHHWKFKKAMERSEVCTRESRIHVKMDKDIYHNEACERKSCFCCFSLIVHRRCRTTTTKEIIEASPFCDPRTRHCS